MNAHPDTSGRQVAGPEESRAAATRMMVRSWWAVAVAFAVTVAAALSGPGPGDTAVWLVAQLLVIVVLGLGAAVTAVLLAARAMRLGRSSAVVPLFIAVFLVLQCLLRVAGTLGRFYGWG
jgi:hypothetical protein